MILADALSRETEGVDFEVRGLNEEVLEVSSNTFISVTISLASTPKVDSSFIGNGESSDFSAFLNQFLEREANNIGKVSAWE